MHTTAEDLAKLTSMIQRHDPSLLGDSFIVGGYAVLDYLEQFDDIGGRVSTEDIDLVLVGDRQPEWRTLLTKNGWHIDERFPFRYKSDDGMKIDLLSLKMEQSTKAETETVYEAEYYIVLAKAIWHEGLDVAVWPSHLLEGMREESAAKNGWWRLNGFGLFLTKYAAITCAVEWLNGAHDDDKIVAAKNRIPRDAQDLDAILTSFKPLGYVERHSASLNPAGRERLLKNYHILDAFCTSSTAKNIYQDEIALISPIRERMKKYFL